MRSSSWTAAAVLALGSAAAVADVRVVEDDAWCREGGWSDGARHCEVREATLPAGSLLAVDARPNGGIQVQGWDGSDVRLRVKIVANADSEAEARDVVGDVRVELGDTVKAVGPARSRGRGWYASYRLEVPRGARLRLQADNGGLHLGRFEGDAELHTVNGGLHVDEVGGHVHGETVNGGIHLELSGTEWRGQGLELRTTNGGLHLTIPEGYNARLEAGTVNGGVHSDVPLTTRGRHTGGRIETDLGGGGKPIRVETTNGGLHLQRR
jgi:DUF4097 and DUF4098 domain-containing protein YvlB